MTYPSDPRLPFPPASGRQSAADQNAPYALPAAQPAPWTAPPTSQGPWSPPVPPVPAGPEPCARPVRPVVASAHDRGPGAAGATVQGLTGEHGGTAAWPPSWPRAACRSPSVAGAPARPAAGARRSPPDRRSSSPPRAREASRTRSPTPRRRAGTPRTTAASDTRRRGGLAAAACGWPTPPARTFPGSSSRHRPQVMDPPRAMGRRPEASVTSVASLASAAACEGRISAVDDGQLTIESSDGTSSTVLVDAGTDGPAPGGRRHRRSRGRRHPCGSSAWRRRRGPAARWRPRATLPRAAMRASSRRPRSWCWRAAAPDPRWRLTRGGAVEGGRMSRSLQEDQHAGARRRG